MIADDDFLCVSIKKVVISDAFIQSRGNSDGNEPYLWHDYLPNWSGFLRRAIITNVQAEIKERRQKSGKKTPDETIAFSLHESMKISRANKAWSSSTGWPKSRRVKSGRGGAISPRFVVGYRDALMRGQRDTFAHISETFHAGTSRNVEASTRLVGCTISP